MYSFGYYKSPIGTLFLQANKDGLVKIDLLVNSGKILYEKPSIIINETKKELDAYFNKKLSFFSIPIVYEHGTKFMQNVWNELRNIPYGKTCSYKDIAIKILLPNGSRAVGNANNKNPIPIIIPCHRVISSNGSLGGYAYGLEAKKYLLTLEN